MVIWFNLSILEGLSADNFYSPAPLKNIGDMKNAMQVLKNYLQFENKKTTC